MAGIPRRSLLHGQRHHPRHDRLERRVIRAPEMARNIDHNRYHLQRDYVQYILGSETAAYRRHTSWSTRLWSLCYCGMRQKTIPRYDEGETILTSSLHPAGATLGDGTSSSCSDSTFGLPESWRLGLDGSCSSHWNGNSIERTYRI
jgi:hypothetical protein